MSETEEENPQKKHVSFSSVWDSPHWQAWWGNGVIAAMGLLNLLILSSTLSPANFGQWGVFITGCGFLELLRTGMVQSSLIKYASGLSEEEQKPYLSAALWLGVAITFLLLLVLFVGKQLLNLSVENSFYLFFNFAPIQLMGAFPLMFALWKLQSQRKFVFMFRIRLVVFGIFTFFVLLHALYPFDVVQLIIFYILGHITGSIICLYNGLAELSLLSSFPEQAFKKMLRFGRYSMGSTTAIHLVKSADTLLLGVFMKPEIVAIYHLPIRLTEWSDLLIRSMAANAYPRLSQISNQVKGLKMKLRFRRITGMYSFITFLFSITPALIMVAAAFWLAEKEYWVVWFTLALSTLIAPFYRFTGIALEALHKPQLNFFKLMLMLSISILGDLFAILYLDSLVGVAVVTLLAYLAGGGFGFFWLQKEFPLKPVALFKQTLRWLRWKWKHWQQRS